MNPLKQYRAAAIALAALILLLLLIYARGCRSTAQGVDIPIPEAASAAPSPLTATPVVIIDPGHGGSDPGSHGVAHGASVYEAPYVADVAERLAEHVRKRGGTAILTRVNARVGIVDTAAWKVLPLARDDTFQSGETVYAGADGLDERLAVVRQALATYPGRRVLFISIHFDAEGTPHLKGVHVITPDPSSDLANSLVEAFRKEGRLRKMYDGKGWRTHVPLLVNGLIRNLYILRGDKNPAPERALVELGNFKNPGDLFRIRSPKVREEYAKTMANAIMN